MLISPRVGSHVTTFIREPAWVSPTLGMEYHAYTEEEKENFRNKPGVLRNLRKQAEKGIAQIFPLLLTESAIQAATRQYMQRTMETKIGNRELADKLIPDFSLGCRRLTVGARSMHQTQ